MTAQKTTPLTGTAIGLLYRLEGIAPAYGVGNALRLLQDGTDKQRLDQANTLMVTHPEMAETLREYLDALGLSATGAKPRTRKDAHADAVQMLRRAADLIDQAHACAMDAKTDDISAPLNNYSSSRIRLSRFSELAESIAHEAETVVCDDCGLLISACTCAWSNAEVK